MSNGGEQGTVTIGEYEIRYHENGDVIDPDNYNKLADAIFWLKNEITTMAWNYLQLSFKPERYTTYEGIISYLSTYQKKYDEGLYHAVFYAPVYPYHHIDLKDVVASLIALEWHLADWMAKDGLTISDEVYSEISSAVELARSYPSFRKGDVVEAEHFNMVVNLAQEAYNIYKKIRLPSEQEVLGPLKTYVWNVWDNVEYWRYAFTEYFKIYEKGLFWWKVGFEDWEDFDYNEPVLLVGLISLRQAKITIIEVEAIFRSALYYGDQLLSSDIRQDVGRSWIVEIP